GEGHAVAGVALFAAARHLLADASALGVPSRGTAMGAAHLPDLVGHAAQSDVRGRVCFWAEGQRSESALYRSAAATSEAHERMECADSRSPAGVYFVGLLHAKPRTVTAKPAESSQSGGACSGSGVVARAFGVWRLRLADEGKLSAPQGSSICLCHA